MFQTLQHSTSARPLERSTSEYLSWLQYFSPEALTEEVSAAGFTMGRPIFVSLVATSVGSRWSSDQRPDVGTR